MKKFRLVKGTPVDPITSEADPARRRILIAMKELRAITTLKDLERAKERGVVLSLDGFRARSGVGTQTLRTKYVDLFEQINPVLDFIYKDVLGIRRNSTGRPRTARAVRKASDLEKKVLELEALLDRRDRDFLDLLEQLRLARSS